MPKITDADIQTNPTDSDDPYFTYMSGEGIRYGTDEGGWNISVTYSRGETILWAYDRTQSAPISDDVIVLRQDATKPLNSSWIWAGGGNDVVTTSDNNDEIQGDAYLGEGGNRIRVSYGNDDIKSMGGNDIVAGNAGDDTIDGGKGDDKLFGDYGSFRVFTDINGDPTTTPQYDPLPAGTTFNDRVKGGDGNDSLYGGYGADVLDGGNNDDYINLGGVYDNGADKATGGEGNDTVENFSVGDSVDLGAGNDLARIYLPLGKPGRITVEGGAGRDGLELTYSGTDAVTVTSGPAGISTSLDATISGFEYFAKLETGDGADTIQLYRGRLDDQYPPQRVYAGGGNDTITGAEGRDGPAPVGQLYQDDNIETGYGDDRVEARSGNDYITNSGGRDTIDAGSGDDLVTGSAYSGFTGGVVDLGEGNDGFVGDALFGTTFDYTVSGGAGNDVLAPIGQGTYVFKPGAGDDQILTKDLGYYLNGISLDYDLDNSDDDKRKITVDYSDAPQGVTVDLAKGTADDDGVGAPDKILFTDDVIGSKFDDVIAGDQTANKETGGEGADRLSGLGGNDTLIGEGGADTLEGGDADDSLSGGADADALSGGDGVDSLSGGADADVLDGGDGNDRLDGGAGEDLLKGGLGNDTLAGGADKDVVSYAGSETAVVVSLLTNKAAGEGTDTLSGFEDVVGSDSGDRLTGDGSVNTLTGGKGADTLDGGAGKDTLAGGDGNDTLLGGTGEDALDGGSEDDKLDGGSEDDSLVGGAGKDALKGGAGDDRLSGGLGDDTLDGGEGERDVASYEKLTTAVVASLLLGTATGSDGKDTLAGIEILVGGSGNDTLTGSAGDGDEIYGGKGNDTLWGGGGASKLDGGEGADTVDYSQAKLDPKQDKGVTADLGRSNANYGTGSDELRDIENVVGTDKDDVLRGNSENNKLEGGKGDDLIGGGAGDDTLDGGSDRDTVTFEEASQAVTASLATGKATGEGTDKLISFQDMIGSDHNDKLTGSTLDNTISGGSGDDTIDGGAGKDKLYGNAGKDKIEGGAGDDEVKGGADADTITDASGFNKLYGESGNDTIGGGVGADMLDGGKDNDTLKGNANGDALLGGAGDDKLYGGADNDTFEVVQYVNAKQEIIETVYGDLAGDDVIDGGEGTDSISYEKAKSGVTVNLATGKASGGGGKDTLVSIEALGGTNFDDVLIGSNAAETFAGFKGNDTIKAGGGNDIIQGTAGADTIDGGSGYDTLVFDSAIRAKLTKGDDGFDLIDTADGAKPDKITGIEKFMGSAGGDVISGDTKTKEEITVDGGKGNDKLSGTAGDDTLTGGDGLDQLRGLDGNDKLSGGVGNDVLDGGNGNDRLDGGAGQDALTGGAGADTFVFAVKPGTADADHITDFAPSSDKIALDHDLFPGLKAGALSANAFYAGTGAHDKDDRVIYDKASGKLWFDADGNGGGKAELIATIDNHAKIAALTAQDFVVI